MKTNATRALELLGIRHRLAHYEIGDEHLAAHEVAARVGLPAEQVWKTLVARGDRTGVCLAVVPGDAELDPKALARLSGDRKVELVALAEVQPLTGYVRGGVTALAGKKRYPVYADERLLGLPEVSVSAGVRGTQLVLAPADYVRATGAVLGPIARR
ncbi:MAG: aminoacyl-tRNA deacylase [Myxococcales bacterium]|nr:aminoacyl-tRNA deacylase [Myxococcales bacterium]